MTTQHRIDNCYNQ